MQQKNGCCNIKIKRNLIRSTVPELMALKLLALARRGLQTSPNIKSR